MLYILSASLKAAIPISCICIERSEHFIIHTDLVQNVHFWVTVPLIIAADGLVSYSAPAGQKMSFRGQQIYLNDTVYDGAISYR